MAHLNLVRQKVAELWTQRMQNVHLAFDDGQLKNRMHGWHGYGVDCEHGIVTITLLCKPGFSITWLMENLGRIQKPWQLRLLEMPQFQHLEAGKNRSVPGRPLAPGNLVFARPKTGNPQNGTIAGFLRATFTKPQRIKSTNWILSCKHVLDPDGRAAKTRRQIRGAGNALIGVGRIVEPKNCHIDAALVEVVKKARINPTYSLALGIKLPDPPLELPGGTTVKKQGNVSGITEGIVIIRDLTAALIDREKEICLCHNILIASKAGKRRFAESGDSGSLVVAAGRPVGIIHSTNPNLVVGNLPPHARPPFALVTRFDVLVDALKSAFRRPPESLRLILPTSKGS